MSLHISTKERVILLVTVVIGMKCPTAAHTARPVRGRGLVGVGVALGGCGLVAWVWPCKCLSVGRL